MRYSQLFGQTLREAPADLASTGMQTLARAGYVRSGQDGSVHLLPLGTMLMARIQDMLQQPCNEAGFQALSLGSCDAPAAEVEDLLRREIHSHRQLPVRLGIRGRSRRAGTRPRYGFLEGRMPDMLHLLALERGGAGAVGALKDIQKTWEETLRSLGLPLQRGRSAGCADWQAKDEHAEALVCLLDDGPDEFLLCPSCGWLEHDLAARPAHRAAVPDEPAALEKVHTPACKTIQELAAYLNIEEAQTAKAVFLVALDPREANGETLIFSLVRGDLEIHMEKLAHHLGGVRLRPADEDEIRAAGAVPGFASPVNLKPAAKGALPLRIVVDFSILDSVNLVGGANEDDMHLRNVNYGRDYQAHLVADIAAARADEACPQCGARRDERVGVEIAWFSRWKDNAHPCAVQGEGGANLALSIILASLDWGRIFACTAEFNRDDHGLTLPAVIAPFDVHLCALADKNDAGVLETAEACYAALQERGVRVLYDERDERPGVKFMDADLVGLALRLTVSGRSLAAGGVEVKRRTESERQIISLDEALNLCTAAARAHRSV